MLSVERLQPFFFSFIWLIMVLANWSSSVFAVDGKIRGQGTFARNYLTSIKRSVQVAQAFTGVFAST